MYSFTADVQSVIDRKPHRLGQWEFDVAEFYPDIGVCEAGSQWTYLDVCTGNDGQL